MGNQTLVSVRVCGCVDEEECCGISQPGVCGLTVRKKKKRQQSAGPDIRGCLANQKINQCLIELSGCVASPGPSVLKKWPRVAEARPNWPSQSIKCFQVCLLGCEAKQGHHSRWSITAATKDDI